MAPRSPSNGSPHGQYPTGLGLSYILIPTVQKFPNLAAIHGEIYQKVGECSCGSPALMCVCVYRNIENTQYWSYHLTDQVGQQIWGVPKVKNKEEIKKNKLVQVSVFVFN